MTIYNIIITGFMGTGKSEVGRILASKLGWEFFDLDEIIEAEQQMKIKEIFATQGESFFRQHEKDVALRLCQKERAVIATGGGTLLNEETWYAMKERGIIFCLTAEESELHKRLRYSENRPLLNGNIESSIKKLMAQRQPIYKKIGHQIDTTGLTPEEVTEIILKALPQDLLRR